MLTDEQLIDLLRTSGAQPAADPEPLAERILRREDNRHRRVRALQYGLPALITVLVLGAAGNRFGDPLVAVFGNNRSSGGLSDNLGADHGSSQAPSGTPSASRSPTPAIRLAGYTVDLPASFTVASVPAGCLAGIVLTAAERTRLVTPPGDRCPLLLSTVLASLPPTAYRQNVQVSPGRTVVLYQVLAGNILASYLPVRRAGGGDVYVALDPRTPATGAQYAQLQAGITVS